MRASPCVALIGEKCVDTKHAMCPVQHAQQLEARLALRLQEAAQRRVIHLDQIRERAAISKEEKEACPPMSPPKTYRGHPNCALICVLVICVAEQQHDVLELSTC